MATLQEQIVEVLLNMNRWHVRGESPSPNYVKIVKPALTAESTLWVGKAGALRRGRTISESISLASGKAALALVQKWQAKNAVVAAAQDAEAAAREEFRRTLCGLDAAGLEYRKVRSERQLWEQMPAERRAMFLKHALAVCEKRDEVLLAMPEPLYTRYIRAQHAEMERRKQTQFVAQIMATGAQGAGKWARGALVAACGGSEDAVNALKIAHDEIGDGSLLASVPEWCAAVNPWARWASQSECVNEAGEVVALVVLCGPTMHV